MQMANGQPTSTHIQIVITADKPALCLGKMQNLGPPDIFARCILSELWLC